MIQLKPEQEELYQFQRISIQCPSTTFDQHVKILCQLQIGDEPIIDIPQRDSNSIFEYTISEKINRIGFKIILTSSNDNNAWQNAQLFRQSIEQTSNDDQSHFLKINATIFKKDSN